MFIGTYTCKLDEKGRFKIPKRYREILAENADEKGTLFFVATDTLRVYTQKGIRELVDELQNRPELSHSEQALPLIRSAISTGMAYYSRFGNVVIPKRLLNRYHLIPETQLLLRGNCRYFEIGIPEHEEA